MGLTTVAVTVLGLTILLAMTVLNGGFASRVVTNGPAPAQLQGAINQAAGQSGAPTGLVTQSEARQLLRTAVQQVYADQPVNLDLAPIEGRLASQAAAVTGLPNGLMAGAAATMVTNQLAATVNDRVNTPQVRELTAALATGRRVNLVAMIGAGGLLVVCVWLALSWPGVLTMGVLSWALLWATLLTATAVAALAASAPTLTTDPTWGPVVVDLVTAVCRWGWQLVTALGLLTLLAAVGRQLTGRMLEKQARF